MKLKIIFLLLLAMLFLNVNSQQQWTSINLISGIPGTDERHGEDKGFHDKIKNASLFTYTDKDTMTCIFAIDHETGKTFSMRVGSVPSGMADPHNYSTMCMSKDGYYLVFYADQRGSVLRMARSNNPHDYTSWTDISLGFRGQYPMPMVTNEGDVYLIWGFIPKSAKDVPKYGTYRPEYLSVSKDNGLTWTTRPFMISWQIKSQLNEFFLDQIIPNEDNTKWYTAWTMGGGFYAPGVPMHDRYHANVYAAYYMPSTDKWYSCQGVEIGNTMDGGCDSIIWPSWKLAENKMDRYCMVRYTGAIRRTPASNGAPSYYQTIVPGTEIIVNGTYHLQNGSWVNIPVKGANMSNVVAGEFKDGNYILYTANQVYYSLNGIDYTLGGVIQQPTWPSGGAINAMVINNPHPSAQIVYLKMNSGQPNGCLRVAGFGNLVTPTPKTPYVVPGTYQVYVNGQVYSMLHINIEDAINVALPLKINNPTDIITISGFNAEVLLK